jgi:hypothetical protein
MCPMCWAALLTTYAAYAAFATAGAFALAGRDRWTRWLAGACVGATVLHWCGAPMAAWWLVPTVFGALVLRVGFVIGRHRAKTVSGTGSGQPPAEVGA